jgi:hypothetical protein
MQIKEQVLKKNTRAEMMQSFEITKVPLFTFIRESIF